MISWRGFRRYRSSMFHGRRIRQTRKYCGLTRKGILTILSSLLLPLMLGIFTVIITFDQKNSSREQRLEDRRLADEQRNQDLNISREQRREDRELSREQRLQDLNQSILQRELERTIANETQNISKQTQVHQLEIEDKRYRDNLLTNYISEMSDLLEKNNGSLTNISLISTLVRLKTLTLIHQLDSNRNSQVIRFLYEAGQLNAREKFLLDLSDVELINIDMSSKISRKKMQNLYLSGVDLTGSSFVNRDLTGANFSSTTLIGVNFSSTILTNTDLSYTKFNGSFNAYKSELVEINLSYANMIGIDFSIPLMTYLKPSEYELRHIRSVNFSNTLLENTRFVGCYFYDIHFRNLSAYIDFSSTIFTSVMFETIITIYLNFSYSQFTFNVTFYDLYSIIFASFFMAELTDVTFSPHSMFSLLQNIQFDFAKLRRVKFVDFFYMTKSSFINATITESTFNVINLINCIFINMTMSNVNLKIRKVENTIFDNAILQDNVVFFNYTTVFRSTFRRAQMQNIKMERCEFISVDMSEANLTNSKMFASHLISSNLTNTDFTGADLSMVNLSHSNLFNARITDKQLHSAISIENSILPNGTIGHDIPLVRNGNADCNKIVEQDWKIEPPNSIVVTKWTTYNQSFNDENDCMFLAVPSLTKNSSTMSQQINVTRYKTFFSREIMELDVTSDCNDYVKINLIQRDINGLILKDSIFPTNYAIFSDIKTTDIEIKVQFDTNTNNTTICDNIRFYIRLFRKMW